MNTPALFAVIILSGALLAVFGSLYLVASRSQKRGELDASGLRILRWALLGHVVLNILLALTAFLT